MRRLTIIESPFSSDDHRIFQRNQEYLRACLRDSWSRGELPFASHGFFPFFLHFSEKSPALERKAGIEAGYQFWDFVNAEVRRNNTIAYLPRIVLYCDYGLSDGMKAAYDRAVELNREHEIRYILGASDATQLAATEQGSTT